MVLSTFILALFVFLQSAVLLGWFAIDGRFIGLVGILFVIVVFIEALLGRPFAVPVSKLRGNRQ